MIYFTKAASCELLGLGSVINSEFAVYIFQTFFAQKKEYCFIGR
jgi:hypothetical protein